MTFSFSPRCHRCKPRMTRAGAVDSWRGLLIGRPGRRGFTLFEIAISLGIVAVGVVSVMMFYPIGIKTQLMARYQLLAAAKAEEMLEVFNAAHNATPAVEHEGLGPWDVPVAYKPHAPDLECRIANHRFGLIPLPLSIAK